MTRSGKVKALFIKAANGRQYKKALRLARQLGADDQHQVLDALFDAAARLRVQRTTGEPILEGAAPTVDGNVTVTWSTVTRRLDGTEITAVETALLVPAKEGPGWLPANKSTEIPEEIVAAVTQASMEW